MDNLGVLGTWRLDICQYLIPLEPGNTGNRTFNLFNTEERNYLPRVNCYFDDIIGTNEFVGELRAIDDFNSNHENKKIAKIFGFSKTRIIPSTWNEQIFLFHDFLHSKYNDFVGLDSSGNEASV